jgi:NADH dehydrogenase
MPPALFVTGGAGFVGRRLLAELHASGRSVVALDRSGSLSRPGERVRVVRGHLLDPASYRDHLQSCDTVLHLAAATGRASAREHFEINVGGTEMLLAASREAGVSRFLFVSSIATTFPDQRDYHYARAKARAEDAVRRSTMRVAILRPTMILGAGAPLLAPLEKLALLPWIVVPGDGRARVQPVHVDDVVRAILAVVGDDRFDGETIEIGGPEAVTIEELLRRLRRARTGRDGRVLHVPLSLLRLPLRAAERAGLARLLPVTAGQLASFRWDGVAVANPVQAAIGPELAGLDAMIAAGNDRAGAIEDALDAECRVFTAHLVGRTPDDYIVSRYRAAHAALPALAAEGDADAALTAFARRSPARARIADAYAARFAPHSALRKKLVVLLAILETSPATWRDIDARIAASRGGALLRMLAAGAGAIAALALGAMLLAPARVMWRRRSRSR